MEASGDVRDAGGVATMLKLCVGSGQRPFSKPFINIDINPRWMPDVVADCFQHALVFG